MPEFVGKLDDVETPEHTDATFTCELNDEEFEVKWFAKKVQLKPSDRYEFSHTGCTHTLTIKDALVKDTGPISCKTQNVSTTANLKVTGKGLPKGIDELLLPSTQVLHSLGAYVLFI